MAEGLPERSTRSEGLCMNQDTRSKLRICGGCYMGLDEAVESIQNSLFWCNWSKTQADAIRTLLLEVEKVKLLEKENEELRNRLKG